MIGKRLMDSLPKDEIEDIAVDFGEVLLDSTLEDGIIKDIPILGTIYSIFKAGRNIKETYFLKKLLIFIQNTSKIPVERRIAFWEEMNKNPKTKEELGDKLIQLLDRIDEIKKAHWISFAFEDLIHGKISQNEFLDLAFTIDAIKAHLALVYYEYYIGYFDQKGEYLNHFMTVGLLHSESLFRTSYRIHKSKIDFKKPDIADKFCSYVWETEQNEIVKTHKGRIFKSLKRKAKLDDRIKNHPDTEKKKITDFLEMIESLSNIQIIRIKPTTDYTIITDELAVITDEEHAYYFNHSGWYNSGMLK